MTRTRPGCRDLGDLLLGSVLLVHATGNLEGSA